MSAGRKTGPGMPQRWTIGTSSLPPMTASLRVCNDHCRCQRLRDKCADNTTTKLGLQYPPLCTKGNTRSIPAVACLRAITAAHPWYGRDWKVILVCRPGSPER